MKVWVVGLNVAETQKKKIDRRTSQIFFLRTSFLIKQLFVKHLRSLPFSFDQITFKSMLKQTPNSSKSWLASSPKSPIVFQPFRVFCLSLSNAICVLKIIWRRFLLSILKSARNVSVICKLQSFYFFLICSRLAAAVFLTSPKSKLSFIHPTQKLISKFVN